VDDEEDAEVMEVVEVVVNSERSVSRGSGSPVVSFTSLNCDTFFGLVERREVVLETCGRLVLKMLAVD